MKRTYYVIVQAEGRYPVTESPALMADELYSTKQLAQEAADWEGKDFDGRPVAQPRKVTLQA